MILYLHQLMFQGRLLIQPIIDMSSILKEILDMVALPYKWIDDKRAIFSYQDKKYGIYIDFLDLKLKTQNGKHLVFTNN